MAPAPPILAECENPEMEDPRPHRRARPRRIWSARAPPSPSAASAPPTAGASTSPAGDAGSGLIDDIIDRIEALLKQA